MAGASAPEARFGRRALLVRASLIGLLAGGLAAPLALTLTSDVPDDLDGLERLSAFEAAALLAAARRMLDGHGQGPADVEAAARDVVRFADGYLGRQPAWMRREVAGLLVLLELGGSLGAGRLGRFSGLPPAAQDAALRAWAKSRWAVLRQAYAGLKGLVMLGAYQRPTFLRAIGYDGPPY